MMIARRGLSAQDAAARLQHLSHTENITLEDAARHQITEMVRLSTRC
jgi:hypothetical protein